MMPSSVVRSIFSSALGRATCHAARRRHWYRLMWPFGGGGDLQSARSALVLACCERSKTSSAACTAITKREPNQQLPQTLSPLERMLAHAGARARASLLRDRRLDTHKTTRGHKTYTQKLHRDTRLHASTRFRNDRPPMRHLTPRTPAAPKNVHQTLAPGS